MSDLRDKLDHAGHAYRRLKYDGDLADDVFARLDAEQDAVLRIEPHRRDGKWRLLLALAATVAVVATTLVTLTRTGRDRSVEVADNVVVVPTAVDPAPSADPQTVEPRATVAEATDFTVVPSYQSFAISVPMSLSLASVDEYDRQAQEQTNDASPSATDPAKMIMQ